MTYRRRESALDAIRMMHRSITMPGSSVPINVRLADSRQGKTSGNISLNFVNVQNQMKTCAGDSNIEGFQQMKNHQNVNCILSPTESQTKVVSLQLKNSAANSSAEYF